MKVHYRGAYTDMWLHQEDNFLYTHEEYANPGWVLSRDHATVQACTATHVVFAVTDPGVNVYDTSKHPFVVVSQYRLALRLVLVPHWAMYRLSEEAGDPRDVEVISYGMTIRSGSTLLGQMFHRLEDTVAVSEPWVLFHVHYWYSRGGVFKEEDYGTFVKAIWRLQCKKLHTVHFHSPQKRNIIEIRKQFKFRFPARGW